MNEQHIEACLRSKDCSPSVTGGLRIEDQKRALRDANIPQPQSVILNSRSFLPLISHLRRTTAWQAALPLLAPLLLFLLLPSFSFASNQDCIVCGKKPAHGHAHVEYRGIEYAACEDACDLVWLQAEQDGKLDGVVEKIEPRGALFQGDSKFLNPVYQQANPMSAHWMVAGIWVLIAIVSAGLAGSLALTTRRSVPLAFGMGLALPVVGLALTLVLPKRTEGFRLRGTKIPSTHDEIACATCGHPLHPSAATCPGCGAHRHPTLESEVQRMSNKGIR